jgi:Holliday junction resolvasome RuvABC ATP-dependent DNA helicase subunit
VEEVAKRRDWYKVNVEVAKPVMVDPRLLARYEKTTELVGINEARDELIKMMMMEGNGVSKQHEKILSIVGFGGLRKTTLANVVYQNLRAQFDCSAFLSVSLTPDMDKLFNNLLYQLGKRNITGVNVIDELREFLGEKRYEQIGEYLPSFYDYEPFVVGVGQPKKYHLFFENTIEIFLLNH